MSAADVNERIDRSIADGRLVKVTRRKDWERLEGSIVARSVKWLLLAIEYDAGSNGHALVRVSDVRRIERYPSSSFVERALAREGHWPLPQLAGVDLSSTRTALESLAASKVLVAIHYEQDHPNECLIGVPRDFGRKKFRLQNVGQTLSGTPRTRSTGTGRSAESTSGTPTSVGSRPSPALHRQIDRFAVSTRSAGRPSSGRFFTSRPPGRRSRCILPFGVWRIPDVARGTPT